MRTDKNLTGVERHFAETDIIVSKTNTKGIITYANRTFLKVSDYLESEVVGKPHNLIRHPEMPRCIFKLLWGNLQSGKEMFAYVVNCTKFGDHYWVLAHATPSFDSQEQIVGYHSNRRVPDRAILEGEIIPLYRDLLDIEKKARDPMDGLTQALNHFHTVFKKKELSYDRFIFA